MFAVGSVLFERESDFQDVFAGGLARARLKAWFSW